jgi:hypothetical protein
LLLGRLSTSGGSGSAGRNLLLTGCDLLRRGLWCYLRLLFFEGLLENIILPIIRPKLIALIAHDLHHFKERLVFPIAPLNPIAPIVHTI